MRQGPHSRLLDFSHKGLEFDLCAADLRIMAQLRGRQADVLTIVNLVIIAQVPKAASRLLWPQQMEKKKRFVG